MSSHMFLAHLVGAFGSETFQTGHTVEHAFHGEVPVGIPLLKAILHAFGMSMR